LFITLPVVPSMTPGNGQCSIGILLSISFFVAVYPKGIAMNGIPPLSLIDYSY